MVRMIVLFIMPSALLPRGTQEWRRLHNKELHSLYRSPNTPNRFRVINSRRLTRVCHVDRMEEGRTAFKILTGTFTGKIPLGRSRGRLKGNISKNLNK